MADSEQQHKAEQDLDTTKTGDVQVEDAQPQIPESAATSIPEVKHQETSDAPAAAASSDAKTSDATKDKKSYPGGERFDPAALPESDDAAEIRKQVEFYFSDSNLTTDKFLYTMVSENQGWADLRTIANFKRMRRFQPFTAVVAALRESTELEVDEKGEKVKRTSELKPFTASNSPVARSVYVKGFPEETKTLQIDLEKFFESFGQVKVVRLRRTEDGLFKGSVFVEFATLEEQEAFLKKGGAGASSSSEEEKLSFQEKPLEVMSKKEYLNMKEQQYGGKFPQSNGKKSFNAFSKENQKSRGGASSGGRGGRGRGRGRGANRGGAGGRGGDRHAERQGDGEDESEEKRGEKRAAEDAPAAETTSKVAKTE